MTDHTSWGDSARSLTVCLFTFARFTGDDPQEAQQADLIHGQASVGPRRIQTAPGTALLPGHLSHQHHVTPLVRTLLQPAHPGWKSQHMTIFHLKKKREMNQYIQT